MTGGDFNLKLKTQNSELWRRPRLRPIPIRPVDYQGASILLNDPLGLSDQGVILPEALGPLLLLFDGTSTYEELHMSFAAHLGLVGGPGLLNQLLEALDQALLLENERFFQARASAVQTYRSLPSREPTFAGRTYPADAHELRSYLDTLLAQVGELEPCPASCRAMLSPHIDFPRGGLSYAEIWKRMAMSARQAELVIVLATDHYSSEPVTLTQQSYATPYGILPTNRRIIDRLAEQIGPEQAYAAELYHRGEHSIELVLTWLHHMRAGQPCEIVPILCGSFAEYTAGADPEDNSTIQALVAGVREAAEQHNALILVSGDLSHVGPAFGGLALDADSEAQLVADDQRVLESMCSGDAQSLLTTMRELEDRTNVCGFPPTWMALRAVAGMHGRFSGYARCPADEDNTSAVTVAGIAFE